MWRYIAKRILLFIPTFFIISILAFLISGNSPIDPVDRLIANNASANARSYNADKEKAYLRELLGLNLPTFYFTLNTLADCDTLHRVSDRYERTTLERLVRKYGNWPLISNYYRALKKTKKATDSLARLKEVNPKFQEAQNILSIILKTSKKKVIQHHFNSLKSLELTNDQLLQDIKKSESAYRKMLTNTSVWKIYIPSFKWHGLGNRYHEWLFGKQVLGVSQPGQRGFIRGDFGISVFTGREISINIFRKFRISLEMVVISVLLAYLISIPIGAFAAARHNSFFDRFSGLILFIMYSLPSFLAAILFLNLFANPDYYEWFNSGGYKSPEIPLNTYYNNWNYWERLEHSWPYMILPIATFTYAQLAFISRIMRTGMLEVMPSDFIRTARAKGLSEQKVIFKHAFKNALLPIITVFSNVFPMAVGGSVVIESIFDYEGMGNAIYSAVLNNDYPVVISFFCLAGLLTMLAFLLSDILYKLVDPRISLK